MRRRELQRVLEAAKEIAARRCDIFVAPYTCITEDDGKGPWSPCDPCLLAQAGVPLPECTATEMSGGWPDCGSWFGHAGSCPLHGNTIMEADRALADERNA